MPVIARAGLGLAALSLCAFQALADTGARTDPDPAWRQAKSLHELAGILDTWLDEQSEYQRQNRPPDIRMTSSSVAVSLRGVAGTGHGRTRGLYDDETSTIYLVQPWNPKDPDDASILLHELVHHRQAPYHFYCPGAQEEMAYRLQDRWLGERGLEAKVNWIAVVLEAGCSRRDVHPD